MNKSIECLNFYIIEFNSILCIRSFLELIHTIFFNHIVKSELKLEIKINSAVNISININMISNPM